ncbi:MAG: nucleotidyltransferase family protein [Ignavibacteriae bacterium]|nr:nucleotidyltransferase family protein [Ignavibacteriota bacterium]
METNTLNKTLAPVLADLIRQHMDELKKDYHVASLAMFGSYVRGDQTPESDVDILVDFHSAIGFFKFIDLEERLSNIIGRKVDLVSRSGIKPRIYEHIKDSLLPV